MAQSGAVLREVGTTNKTRASDYAAAIGERTALILRVHPSNFRIEGFTERPALTDLVTLGQKFAIPIAEDLGSGYLGDGVGTEQGQSGDRVGTEQGQSGDGVGTEQGQSGDRVGTEQGQRGDGVGTEQGQSGDRVGTEQGRSRVRPRSVPHEPAVPDSVAAGVDLCCFSGDKLLGGPQAGIIVGRRSLVDRIRAHPLMRALRVDKMTYAALEATLTEYVAGRAASTIPVQRMLTLTADDIRARARTLAATLNGAGWRAEIIDGSSAIGGGSAPGIELPTALLAIERRGVTAAALGERLRRLQPPVIARIEQNRVLLDLRTVLPDDDEPLARALTEVERANP
jgi:seryl-tRNA(Sec) selenium transferase